jgi:hypothetical protein
MAVTNENFIHERIKIRLNMLDACYRFIQNLSSPHLISERVKLKIYNTGILHVVLWV